MNFLMFISEAASVDSAVSATESHETTLNEAVQDLVAKPEETLSAIGDFFVNLGKNLLNAIPSVILAIIILIVGMILTKLCIKLMSKGLSKTKLDLTVIKFTTQIAKIALYVLLITIVLSMLGIPSTSIITVIGTAGVAIGLALQNSLSNVAGGFLLMITKPFKIGDYIITNGVEGTVTQISILHTRLDSATNQAIFIPNGLAVNATVINNSGNDTRRVDLEYAISYEDDFEKAQKVILDVLNTTPGILKTPAPTVRILKHAESAIVIAVRPWCKGTDYWDVFFDLNEKIRAAFLANDISIPYNQLDVHLVESKKEESQKLPL